MDVWCSGCGVKYTFDPAKVPPEGVNVRCTRCNAVFRVDAPEAGSEALPPVALPRKSAPPARRSPTIPPARVPVPRMRSVSDDPLWTVRHSDGTTLQFRDMTTLQKWVVEQKVTRDDEFSRDGHSWSALGDVDELQSFFNIVDAANSRGYFGAQTLTSSDHGVEHPVPTPYDTTPLAGDLLNGAFSEPSSGSHPQSLAYSTGAMSLASSTTQDMGAEATQPMSLSELAQSYGEASQSAAPTSSAERSEEESRAASDSQSFTISEALLGGASDSGSFWATELNPATRTGEMRPQTDDDTIAHWQKQEKSAQVWRGVTAVSSLIVAVAAWWFWPSLQIWMFGAGPPSPETESAALASRAAEAPPAVPAEMTPPGGLVPTAPIADEKAPPVSAGATLSATTERADPVPVATPSEKTIAVGVGDALPAAGTEREKLEASIPSVSGTEDGMPPSVNVADGAAPGVSPKASEGTPPTPTAPVATSGPPVTEPPGDVAIILQRAERLRESDRTLDALALYQQAKELRPDDPQALAGMGWCFVDLERFADAARTFAQVLRTHPTDAVSHFGLAEASSALGDAEQARESYGKYLELAPRGPDARMARSALEKLEKTP